MAWRGGEGGRPPSTFLSGRVVRDPAFLPLGLWVRNAVKARVRCLAGSSSPVPALPRPPRVSPILGFLSLTPIFATQKRKWTHRLWPDLTVTGCNPAVVIKEGHLHVSVLINLRNLWLNNPAFWTCTLCTLKTDASLRIQGFRLFDFDKMSACYVFVFFLVFADLCCKCTFTRMLWFFEYYEACTLRIKDFMWLTLLRRCGKRNTFHLYLIVYVAVFGDLQCQGRPTLWIIGVHSLPLLFVVWLQIALLDSPTALSMEEKLQQNEARVSDTLTCFRFCFNHEFHYFKWILF